MVKKILVEIATTDSQARQGMVVLSYFVLSINPFLKTQPPSPRLVQTLKQLAEFFHVSIDYLVIGYDSTSPITQCDNKPNDLLEFLQLANVRFGNKILTEEDKAKIKASLDIIFWDTKQKTDGKNLK